MRKLNILLVTLALLFASACSSSKKEEKKGKVDLSNFDIGTVNDYTYTNEYLGLKLALDDNWYFATEKELEEITNDTSEFLENTEAGDMLEKGKALIICYAENLDGLANVVMMVEKKTVQNVTVDQVIDPQISLIEEQFKSMGLEDAVCTKGKTVFLGENVPCITTIASTENGIMHQTTVIHLVDRLIVTITATSFTEDITERILMEFAAQ